MFAMFQYLRKAVIAIVFLLFWTGISVNGAGHKRQVQDHAAGDKRRVQRYSHFVSRPRGSRLRNANSTKCSCPCFSGC